MIWVMMIVKEIMRIEITNLYICEYCGTKHEDENWMKMHEDVCPLNPKNQPCSTCERLILGLGCSKKMDMEQIDGKKVKCFFYKKGIPQNIFTMTLDGEK